MCVCVPMWKNILFHFTFVTTTTTQKMKRYRALRVEFKTIELEKKMKSFPSCVRVK